MARPKASAVDVGDALDVLRGRYADLARKYAVLVERLGRRVGHDLAIYRLESFGRRVGAVGLALIARDGIQLANARFTELARRMRGPLSPLEPGAGPAHPNLPRLILEHAQPMLDRRSGAAELRYRDAGSAAVVAVHLELSVTSRKRLVMAVVEEGSDTSNRDEEPAATREAVLQRERLRVLGELAASIAHDLGNTLRGASFQLATLRETAMPASHQRAVAMDAVARRVEVASKAISRLHDFARTGSLGISAVRLDRIVAQAVALLDVDFHAASKPIEVRVRIPDLPQVRGSVAELSLLFVNLLRNARDAMPSGGMVTVAARRQKDCVLVTVTDQGTGIPPEVQARLFEPFFTTKGPSGTGLGLWLAAGTMKRLGGSIRAAAMPKGGAAFLLRFPLVKPSRPPRSADLRRGAKRGVPWPTLPRRRRSS